MHQCRGQKGQSTPCEYIPLSGMCGMLGTSISIACTHTPSLMCLLGECLAFMASGSDPTIQLYIGLDSLCYTACMEQSAGTDVSLSLSGGVCSQMPPSNYMYIELSSGISRCRRSPRPLLYRLRQRAKGANVA